MEALLEEIEEKKSDDSGDFAHYAEASKVTEAYVMGTPIKALCGKIFIPHKDPSKFPICPTCKDIVDSLFLYSE